MRHALGNLQMTRWLFSRLKLAMQRVAPDVQLKAIHQRPKRKSKGFKEKSRLGKTA
jgi:hypothetical protein